MVAYGVLFISLANVYLKYRQDEDQQNGLGVVAGDESGGTGDASTENNRDSTLKQATRDIGPQFVLEVYICVRGCLCCISNNSAHVSVAD